MKNHDACNKALTKRNNLDFQGISMLRDILKMINWDNGKQRFLEILAEYHGFEVEDAQRILDEAQRIIDERNEAHEEFIQELAKLNK